MAGFRLCWVFIVAVAAVVGAGEPDKALLRLKIEPNQALRYDWTTQSSSESAGMEKGKSYVFKQDITHKSAVLFKGLLLKRQDMPVALRFTDVSYADKRSIDQSVTDLFASRTRVKYVENGKTIVDSDNDIGLDKIGEFQGLVKSWENHELRMVLDGAGKPSELQGENTVVDAIKRGGSQGIFPILSGTESAAGQTWDDSYTMSSIGQFLLSQPLTVRSKMLFSRWEEKDGRKLARIDIVTNWDRNDVHGENNEGMLVTISKIDATGTGTCLFDPQKGLFLEGSVTLKSSYRIDGELNGEKTGMDVKAQSTHIFTHRPEK